MSGYPGGWIRRVSIQLALPLATFFVVPAAAQDINYQYAAKFLCGISEGLDSVPANHNTIVSIHNPEYRGISARFKIAAEGIAGEDGHIGPFTNIRLGPDGATRFRCKEILGFMDDPNPVPPLVSGFFVLESSSRLDVVTTVSTASPDGTSVDLEITKAEPRSVKHEMPDLIIDSLCVFGVAGRPSRATARVKNIGGLAAGASTLRLLLTPVNDGGVPTGPVQPFDLDVPGLGTGVTFSVEQEIPAQCFGPNCRVTGAADVLDAVIESDEGNNTSGETTCIG